MLRNSNADESKTSRPEPMELTPDEIAAVAGGGANVRHGNSGGQPASYNVHTSTGPGPAWYNLT